MAIETKAEVVASEPLQGEPNAAFYKGLVLSNLALFDANRDEVRFGVRSLGGIVLRDADDRESAYQLVKAANKALILIEKRLKEVLAPLTELANTIKGYAKDDLIAPLQEAIGKADSLILSWDKQEAARKEEERKKLEAERLRIAEVAAAAQKKIDDERAAELAKLAASGDFASRQAAIQAMAPGIRRIQAQRDLDAEKAGAVAKVEAVAAQAVQEAAIDKSLALSDVRGKAEDLDAKTKGSMKVWEWEVVNFTELSDAFKKLDESAVREALKGGAQSIRGLKLWQVEKLRH